MVAQRQRPMPVPAHNERVSSILTTAVTSAGVSLLTMWLWGPVTPPGTESLDAASKVGEQAPEPQVVLGMAVVNAPIPAAAPSSPALPLARNAAAIPPALPLAAKASPISRALRLATNASPVSAAPGSSRLVVITEPEGARVTINGMGWGTTPLTIHNLPSGARRVRVTKSGYQGEERVVGNGARATATLRIVLREARR